MSDNSGVKFDEDKVRMDLLPPELLFAVAKIMTFGAQKYTTTILGEICRVLNVEKIAFIAKGCAVLVTKNNSGKIILSTLSDSEKTLGDGGGKTQIVCEHWLSVEKMIQENGLEMPSLSELNTSAKSDLPSIKRMNSWQEAVKYAEQQNTSISTIVMRQGSLGECFVASTTTASDSLATILKGLKPHFDISDLKLRAGERNWEQGMSWGRVFAALMRHMWAWWRGEDKDPETGESHLWHAGCCIAFLIAYEARGVGTDDRYKAEDPPSAVQSDEHHTKVWPTTS